MPEKLTKEEQTKYDNDRSAKQLASEIRAYYQDPACFVTHPKDDLSSMVVKDFQRIIDRIQPDNSEIEKASRELYYLHDRDINVTDKGRPSSDEWGIALTKLGEALGVTGVAQENPKEKP